MNYIKGVLLSTLCDAKRINSFSMPLFILVLVAAPAMGVDYVVILWLVTFSLYPCFSEETGKANVCFLPITKQQSVFGRYIFSFILFWCWYCVNLAIRNIWYWMATYTFLHPLFDNGMLEIAPLSLGITFCLYLFYLAVEYPLIYWIGYIKAAYVRLIFMFSFMFIMRKLAFNSMWGPLFSTPQLVVGAVILFVASSGLSNIIIVRKNL